MDAFDQYFNALRGKKIAVLGLGVSNRPLVQLLLEYGCDVTGCDRVTREKLDEPVLALERAGCHLRLGEDYLAGLQADVVFRTPGMHPGNPAICRLREQGAEITSEMDVFFQVAPCHLIAVTGSDGKTTTTTLIAEMLKAAGKTVWLGGNIGTPLLPLCRRMQAEDYAVVELSSFQLMDMTRSPQRAVVTNLAPNHLDVHKDMEEYFPLPEAEGFAGAQCRQCHNRRILRGGGDPFFLPEGTHQLHLAAGGLDCAPGAKGFEYPRYFAARCSQHRKLHGCHGGGGGTGQRCMHLLRGKEFRRRGASH